MTTGREIERRDRFESFYRTHYEAVLAYALRRSTHETAIDATAETFLIAWRRFDEISGNPVPWLLGVARRVLANQFRSTSRSQALVDKLRAEITVPVAPRSPDPADTPVIEAFARLSPLDREALALIAWEGLEPREAARVLGMSAVAFRSRLHRARRRLEKALARGSGNPSVNAISASLIGARECRK
jgi:RNA polymerase sigma-70 factor (ECF subfamily)